MTECEPLIKKGVILRNTVTLLSLFVLFYNLDKKGIRKYLFLILPILLNLGDNSDNFFLYSFENFIPKKKRICAKTFYYQNFDKISDSVAYAAVYLFLLFFLKHDALLLFFVLYRIAGVFLFSTTKDSAWLVVFFDFVKEYLLYLFLFGKQWKYLPFFITLKIVFEYYFHSMVNKTHY